MRIDLTAVFRYLYGRRVSRPSYRPPWRTGEHQIIEEPDRVVSALRFPVPPPRPESTPRNRWTAEAIAVSSHPQGIVVSVEDRCAVIECLLPDEPVPPGLREALSVDLTGAVDEVRAFDLLPRLPRILPSSTGMMLEPTPFWEKYARCPGTASL